jgi:putative heme-binding domain-containing protein
MSAATTRKAMADEDAGVRRWAVRFGEKLNDKDQEVGAGILELAHDADAQVRLQVAYTLGAGNEPRAARTLGQMAIKHANDPYLTAAVLSSATKKNLVHLVKAILDEGRRAAPPPTLVAALTTLSMSMRDAAAFEELMRAATEPVDGRFALWQLRIVAERFGNSQGKAFYGLIDGEADRTRVNRVVTAARQLVHDPKAGDEDKAVALSLLGQFKDGREEDMNTFRELLSPTTSPSLRATAVTQIATRFGDDMSGLLLEAWKAQPPATRAQILDALLTRKSGPGEVLAAIEAKKISPGEIDAARRQRLLTHNEKPIRDRAARLFDGAANPDRARVIKEYSDLAAGDKEKGKAVFTRVCAACHKLGEIGAQVGPDLAALANRTPAYLLQEILDPNRNLDSRYVEYQAITKSQRNVTGILAAETASTIILRGQQGKEETLLRTDIEELRASGKSLMPEGIEKDVSKKEMADLLAFLTATRPPPKAFAGNTPALVKAVDRHLTLRATEAEIYGGDIAFESEFKNIGMWHGEHDHAEWRIEVDKTNTYDIFLDFACDAGSAGNELLIEGANPTVRWKVTSTGTWAQYQTVRVGIVKLTAGEGRIVVRPAGPLRGALIDLRTVYILPPGQTPPADSTASKDPTDAAAVAKMILDDAQPVDRRNRLIASNAHQSADLIRVMTADIKDAKEEYRRIPWIWRVSIAAGKRNDLKEVKAILAVSLPGEKDPLRDWQAVVVGGGLVNGITQAGAWPGRRVAELLKDEPDLQARWKGAVKLSFAMADDEKVPNGTRYDALRMVALADWETASPVLTKYLAMGVHSELQMGAVSGLGDVESPRVAELLLKSLPDLTEGNRKLALTAMTRTAERANGLLDAVAAGTVKAEWLAADHRQALLSHSDADVRKRAAESLKK